MDLPLSLYSGQSSESLEPHSYAISLGRGITKKGIVLMSRYAYVRLHLDIRAVLTMVLDRMVELFGEHKYCH